MAARNKLHGLRGSAAVETAVLLPLLVLLGLGTVDFGRFLHAQIAVATAARNGAQFGSASTGAAQDTTGIRTASRNEMTTIYGYNSTNPSVTSSVIQNGPTDSRVRVTVTFQFQTLAQYPGLPKSLNLIRTVHMRIMPNNGGGGGGGDDDDD